MVYLAQENNKAILSMIGFNRLPQSAQENCNTSFFFFYEREQQRKIVYEKAYFPPHYKMNNDTTSVKGFT